MKVLQFTIPVPENKSIIVLPESLPFFFPHLHRHKEIQLTWIINGEGTLVVDDSMHPFRSNDIFFLGANQAHVFKNDSSYFIPDSNKGIEALTLFFNPNGLLGAFFNLPEMKQVRNFIDQSQTGFHIPSIYAAKVCKMMQHINEFPEDSVDRIVSFIDLLKLLTTLRGLHALSSGLQSKHYSEEDGSRIGKIYNFLMANFDRQISLYDVASLVHMTTQSFCRYFRKHTGKTFIAFLNEIRIHEACRMLTETASEGISSVAYRCGFNSITNFNRIFRSIKGMTPSEYQVVFKNKVYDA